MLYKIVGSIVALLCLESSVNAMGKALHEAAVAALLKGDDSLAAEVDQAVSVSAKYYKPFVRSKLFNENLSTYWETIPVVTRLLRAIDNNHLQAFSFIGASTYAIAATKKGRLFLWDTEAIVYDEEKNAQPLAFRESGHSELSCMAVSDKGSFIATAGDSCIKIWTAIEELVCIATLQHPGVVCTLSFNESATELVAGDAEGTLRVWNVEDLTKPCDLIVLGKPFGSNDLFATFNRVLAARLCADGRRILAAGYIMHEGAIKPIIRVLNRSGGESILEMLVESRSPILGKLTFIDDFHAITTFTNGDIFNTDIAQGMTKKLAFNGLSSDYCESIVLSDDGRYVLMSSHGKVILWECCADGYEKVREFKVTEPIMNKCALRSDKAVFLMGSTLAGISFANLSLWTIKQPFDCMSLVEARGIIKRRKLAQSSEGANQSS